MKKWLKENDAKIGAQGKEIQSNVTDNDSAKMKTSHGTIQGYNGQALVDKKHQVVVHSEAFGNGQDSKHMAPMLDGAKKNLKKIGKSEDYLEDKILTADSNYHSQTNLKKCQKEKLDTYIPDLRFRTRDSRFATRPQYRPQKGNKFLLKDFHYDQSKDCYICPKGKILKREVKKLIRNRMIYRRYRAAKGDCRRCPLANRCFHNKDGKRRALYVPIGAEKNNLSKRMHGKVDSEQGRKIYPQRIAIVEPVFANIRTQKRMDRFTLRSKIKVNIQWMLYCMVHNIEKIANYASA